MSLSMIMFAVEQFKGVTELEKKNASSEYEGIMDKYKEMHS
jgi:hypothetical protein